MRFSPQKWEQERRMWRLVVLMHVISRVNTILELVKTELDTRHSHTPDNIEAVAEGAIDFTEHHKLLVARLEHLVDVESELQRILGYVYKANTTGYHCWKEYYVRSWTDALEGVGAGEEELECIDNCIYEGKEDMKTLWNDPTVRAALKKHHLQIEADSATGLYVPYL